MKPKKKKEGPKSGRQKIPIAAESKPSGEPVSSLATLQLFRFEGCVYSKRRQHGGEVTGLSQEGDRLIRLLPDTIVEPL